MHVIDLIVNIHPFVLLYSCAVSRGIYGFFLICQIINDIYRLQVY